MCVCLEETLRIDLIIFVNNGDTIISQVEQHFLTRNQRGKSMAERTSPIKKFFIYTLAPLLLLLLAIVIYGTYLFIKTQIQQ